MDRAQPTPIKIDFVSDVSCPWCAIGLASLEQALARLDGRVAAQLRFEPFELNPAMPPEGQDIGEHLRQKYGSSPEQQAGMWQTLVDRGQAVGFTFRPEGRGRIWNTFAAHRLLHWAGLQGAREQAALKKALLAAYFTHGRSPADVELLVQAAQDAGLDAARAREIATGDAYTAEVRERQAFWAQHGIRAVPSVIVNDRHLIQGGQPPEVFEQALAQIAAGAA